MKRNGNGQSYTAIYHRKSVLNSFWNLDGQTKNISFKIFFKTFPLRSTFKFLNFILLLTLASHFIIFGEWEVNLWPFLSLILRVYFFLIQPGIFITELKELALCTICNMVLQHQKSIYAEKLTPTFSSICTVL